MLYFSLKFAIILTLNYQIREAYSIWSWPTWNFLHDFVTLTDPDDLDEWSMEIDHDPKWFMPDHGYERQYPLEHLSEFEARLKHILRLNGTSGTPWDPGNFHKERAKETRVRRAFVIRCCGWNSKCTGPNRKSGGNNKQPIESIYNQALAYIEGDGIAVSCPNCEDSWKDKLDWKGDGSGVIKVVCRGCPENWRETINLDGTTTVIVTTVAATTVAATTVAATTVAG